MRRNNPVDMVKGFTLIELAVTLALLTIVLPAATLMFTSVFSSFRTLSDQTNLTQKSNFVLNKFSKEMNELEEIVDVQTEPEDILDGMDKNAFIYTNSFGERKGMKIAAEMTEIPGEVLMNKFQYCDEDCDNPDAWYDLADDEDLVPNYYSNKILYFIDGIDRLYIDGVDDKDSINYIGLSLIFKYQDQDVPYDIIIYLDRDEE
jgi:prepilin-type N-terminal cleavage/methylation domain-containing protein